MSSIIRKFSKELRTRQTPAEIKFKEILQRCQAILDFRYEFQKSFWNKDYPELYIVDFYVGRQRVVFEIDGGYHSTPEQQEKDARRDIWFKSRQIEVIRFRNEETEDIEYCKNVILKTLYGRKWLAVLPKPSMSLKRKKKKRKCAKTFIGGKVKWVENDAERLPSPVNYPIKIKNYKKGNRPGLRNECTFVI